MLHAYAWTSGLIEFGKWVPGGALELLAGDAETVKYRICTRARLAWDNESWLVPGVPEARTREQKNPRDAALRRNDRHRRRAVGLRMRP